SPGVEHHGAGVAEDVPAARSFERINPGLCRSNCHTSRGHSRSRLRAAGYLEPGVELAEIRPSRHEAEQIHRVGARRMQLDNLIALESGLLGDGVEIQAAVFHRNQVMPWFFGGVIQFPL